MKKRFFALIYLVAAILALILVMPRLARADVEVVTDTFTRTVSNGLGNADSGQAYTLVGGNSTDYGVNGSEGRILHSVASTSREGALTTVSVTNQTALIKVKVDKVPAGGNHEVQFIARRVASNTNYRVRLIFNTTSNMGLFATRVVSGTTANLGSQATVSVTPTADTYVWFKAEVTGTSPTTINSKVWEDGQAEPGSWQYTTTDSQAELQVAAGVGLRTNVTAGSTAVPITFSFDSFTLTEVGASPTPTPTASPAPTATPTPSPTPDPGTVSSTDFIQADGETLYYRNQVVLLKGVNFDNVDALGASIGTGDITDINITEADYETLREKGGNHARFGLSFNWYQDNRTQFFQVLDQHVTWARAHGIWLVLNMFTTPGDCYEGYSAVCDIWVTPSEQQELEDFWVDVATHYAYQPAVAGYGLLNEPNPQGPDYCTTWFNIASSIRDAVFAVAPRQLVFIAACSDPGNSLRYRDPPFGTNIVYEVHDYTPISLTHSSTDTYPGTATEWYGTCTFNKSAFQGNLQPGDPSDCPTYTNLYTVYGLDWGEDNNVPMYIGEWGATATLNGYVLFHQDKADLYSGWGVNNAVYTWKHNTSVTGGSNQWGIYSDPLRLDEPLKLAAIQSNWFDMIYFDSSITPATVHVSSVGGGGEGTCQNAPPVGVPDLFQINRSGTQATLYFAPAIDQYNSYFIAYGIGNVTEQFGVEFSQSHTNGVIKFVIKALDPRNTYSFKVRAGNGCMPGKWGNTLKVTPARFPRIFYRPRLLS